jgi:hypothetical protein
VFLDVVRGRARRESKAGDLETKQAS